MNIVEILTERSQWDDELQCDAIYDPKSKKKVCVKDLPKPKPGSVIAPNAFPMFKPPRPSSDPESPNNPENKKLAQTMKVVRMSPMGDSSKDKIVWVAVKTHLGEHIGILDRYKQGQAVIVIPDDTPGKAWFFHSRSWKGPFRFHVVGKPGPIHSKYLEMSKTFTPSKR